MTIAPWVPDDLERLPNIPFTIDTEPPQRLDVYRLRGARPGVPRPTVLWLHGGGWMSGNKERGVERIFDLVRAGFVGASADYRLSQEALFPAQLHDCKCAVRFLRAHAPHFDIDAARIGAWGASAGGHLASLLAVTGRDSSLEGSRGWESFSSEIQAACSWYGPTDLNLMNHFPPGITPRMPSMNAESAEGRLVGGPVAERQDLVAMANPISYIHADTPPVLLMHGAKDDCVPLASCEKFYEALVERRVPAEIVVIEDGGHNADDWSDEHYGMARAFFERRLQ